jgi:hypothetical protein
MLPGVSHLSAGQGHCPMSSQADGERLPSSGASWLVMMTRRASREACQHCPERLKGFRVVPTRASTLSRNLQWSTAIGCH